MIDRQEKEYETLFGTAGKHACAMAGLLMMLIAGFARDGETFTFLGDDLYKCKCRDPCHSL